MIEDYPRGDWLITKPDGTNIVEAKDGSVVTYLPDGAVIGVDISGSGKTWLTDGTVTQEYPGGAVTKRCPDGTVVEEDPNGYRKVSTWDRQTLKEPELSSRRQYRQQQGSGLMIEYLPINQLASSTISCAGCRLEGPVENKIAALLELVPAIGGNSVTVQPLAGGLTNRNYRLDVDGQSYVLRLFEPHTTLLGIDRVCEHACSRAAAAAGVGAEVIAFLPDYSALITRFLTGRVLTSEDIQQPTVIRRLAKALRRYHDSSPGAGAFSPFAVVRNYYSLSRERGVSFPDSIGRAMDLLASIEQELNQDEQPLCPCHNDLLASNFIDDGTDIRIVDWEYAGMGNCFFDLGNLAVNNQFQNEHERELLAAYFGEVLQEHLRCLHLMRLASDMREAMWGFLQAGISLLDFDYLGYGIRHLERFLVGCEALSTGLAGMQGTGGSRVYSTPGRES